MKKNNVLAIACALLLGVSSVAPLCAQERGDWSMTIGTDVASHYLWRGMELGGPSIQPSAYFDYEKGDWAVSLGLWGTKSFFKNRYGDHYSEMDISMEASWRGLTLSVIDYGEDYSAPWQEGHFLDVGLSYTLSDNIPVTFSWYSIVNQTHEGSMLDGGKGFDWKRAFPSYFEVAYEFSLSVIDFSVAAGLLPFASEYYENDHWGVCNLNLSVGHEFEFKHGGALPVSGQVMYNPLANEFFWGVSVGYYFTLDF